MIRRFLRSYWPFCVFLALGIAGAIRAHLSFGEAIRGILVTLAFVAVVIAVGRQIGKGPWI